MDLVLVVIAIVFCGIIGIVMSVGFAVDNDSPCRSFREWLLFTLLTMSPVTILGVWLYVSTVNCVPESEINEYQVHMLEDKYPVIIRGGESINVAGKNNQNWLEGETVRIKTVHGKYSYWIYHEGSETYLSGE